MKILAIETSCDETSVAVVEDGQHLHSLVVNSQIDLHRAFGGVVPEIAARSHIEVMLPVVTQALEEAFGAQRQSQESRVKSEEKKLPSQNHTSYLIPRASTSDYWDQIDAIAVTQGPGLLGALLIGVLTARTLAWSLNKPLYPVHHIMGHAYANWITGCVILSENEGSEILHSVQNDDFPSNEPEFPVLALIVSGGHTQIMHATSHTDWKIIGRTEDDAVGEAFDKAAKVLGLPYPGGPSIEKCARDGDPSKYKLTTPRVAEKYGFSFSGLKTGLLRAVQKECGKSHDFPSFELAGLLNDAQKADFAASFQQTAINYLVSKMKLAFEEYQPKTVIIGGGVAASPALRQALSREIPLEIEYAPQILCTDNAAMIGARAYYQAQFEEPVSPLHLDPKPSWPL